MGTLILEVYISDWTSMDEILIWLVCANGIENWRRIMIDVYEWL